MECSRIKLLILILLLLATSCGSPEWKEFSSDDGGFRIHFPGKPKAGSQIANTKLGQVVQKFYTVSLHFDHISYGIYYSDYPESVSAIEDEKAEFDGIRDGIISAHSGSLMSESEVELNGYSGREFFWKGTGSKNPIYGSARLLLVDFRLYIIMVVTTSKYANETDAERFFNSFELL